MHKWFSSQEEERFRDIYSELQRAKDDIDKKEKIISAFNENSRLQEEIINGLKSKLQEEKGLHEPRIQELQEELTRVRIELETAKRTEEELFEASKTM